MGNGRNQDSAQASFVTAADQLRAGLAGKPVNQELPPNADIEDELKELSSFWPRDDAGRIRWPEPNPDSPGDLMARARLERFLTEFQRAYYNSDLAGEAGWKLHRLFLFMQRDLKAGGRTQWDQRLYDLAWRGAGKSLDKEAAEERAARLEAQPKAVSRAGRRPTDRTARVQLIRETTGCGRSRAYEIEAEGTSNLQDRLALAAAFADDPDRDTPAKWGLKFGGKHGRPSERTSFADYIASYEDAFENDLSSALAILRDVYLRGALPVSFRDLRTFVATMHRLGIGEGTAVRLWDRSALWCANN